jgi:hypothetical protein
MATVQEIYEHTIRPLTARQQLRLAALILNDISSRGVLDVSDAWSDEDCRDFSAAGWQRFDFSVAEEADE